MNHSHSHHHAHSSSVNRNRLLSAFLVTALFTIAEVVGGILSGSLALMADAGHMLTDAAALLMALLAIYFSARKPTLQHSFGYLRLTTVAAFINAVALLIMVILIIWEAVSRFFNPQPVLGLDMLIIAVLGMLANLLSFWLLHHGEEKANLNIRAATLHIMGDLLGSVGAIVASIVILWTNWMPIDPILSVFVSCLVLRSGWRLLKESLNELLEGTPLDVDVVELQNALCQAIPAILNIHHIHIWQIGERRLMTLHLQASPEISYDTLLAQVQNYLSTHYQIKHATIQIEKQLCAENNCCLDEATPDEHAGHSHVHSH